jgi:hypothetical protein
VAEGTRPGQRVAVAAGVAAAAIAAMLSLANVGRVARSATSGQPYVRTFDNAQAPLRKTLATGDGQAYAALAADPTLARPGVFRGGTVEAAYRAQRPLPGVLAWLLSAGRSGLVPWALLALGVTGIGGAGYALARIGGARSGPPLVGVAVAVLPGSVAAMSWLGPDTIALGLALLGLLWWLEGRRRGLAGLAFALAALARETTLLVPAVLAVDALRRRDRRDAAAAAVTALPCAAWTAVVRLRLGAWPWAAAGGRVGAPLGGLVDGIARWQHPFTDGVCLVLAASALAVAVLRRRDVLAQITLAYGAFALFMGVNVWLRWEDFTRPLAPLYALGLVLVFAPKRPGTNAASGTAHTALQ